ncbi:MAG: hypothetical protein QW600_02485 [Candidatus Bathyarchaeia archaeon]|nr:hypothetical protein [Candidatus Bathyarchaeota archaeon]
MSGTSKRAEAPKISHILSIAYFAIGIILLVVMTQSKHTPFHLGLVGALNIFASYSMTKMKWWSVYAVAIISLVNLVFGSVTLAAAVSLFSPDAIGILILLCMITYIVLSLTLLVYIVYRRGRFP